MSVPDQASIGIVLVTHGLLCEEFRQALEHVVGPQTGLACVAIAPDDDDEMRRSEILDAVRSVDIGAGVAVLTDMFGGTPSNLAISIMDEGRIEVLAGLNLPMLVKLARLRETTPLEAAVTMAADAGRKYISVASHVLMGK